MDNFETSIVDFYDWQAKQIPIIYATSGQVVVGEIRNQARILIGSNPNAKPKHD